MIIEIAAIETTGLDASKDRIVEAAVGRLWNEGFKMQHALIDPGDAELSPEIIEYHTRTGLWSDMAKHGRKPLEETTAWLGSSSMRVVWALDFARPFLRGTPLEPALSSAVDARGVLRLAQVLKGFNAREFARAHHKVEEIAGALKALKGDE